MAEPVVVDNGTLTDYSVLVDDVIDGTLGTGAKQMVGIMDATVGGTNKAEVSAGGALKVDGSAATQPVSIAGAVPVTDNAGSLTVDQPTGTNLHTVLDSGTLTGITNVVHVDDNGGILTVDGTVAVTQPVAVTDNAGSLTVDQPTGTNLHTVLDSGTLTGITNVVHVDDNTGSLTVDQATGSNLHTVLDSGTLTGITNVVHVDDNTGSLTVDQPTGTNLHTVVDSGTVGISGTVDTELPAAAALTDATANPTVPAVGAFTQFWNGATWDRLAGNAGRVFVADDNVRRLQEEILLVLMDIRGILQAGLNAEGSM